MSVVTVQSSCVRAQDWTNGVPCDEQHATAQLRRDRALQQSYDCHAKRRMSWFVFWNNVAAFWSVFVTCLQPVNWRYCLPIARLAFGYAKESVMGILAVQARTLKYWSMTMDWMIIEPSLEAKLHLECSCREIREAKDLEAIQNLCATDATKLPSGHFAASSSFHIGSLESKAGL